MSSTEKPAPTSGASQAGQPPAFPLAAVSAAPCPKCQKVGRYVRTRYFEDEAADVWECVTAECANHGLIWHVSRPYAASEILPTLIAMRDHHREQARIRYKSADETRRDLDRMITEGSGPVLFPGRWPETLALNEREMAFERDQAAEHSRFATAAEAARLLLLNVAGQGRPERSEGRSL